MLIIGVAALAWGGYTHSYTTDSINQQSFMCIHPHIGLGLIIDAFGELRKKDDMVKEELGRMEREEHVWELARAREGVGSKR